MATVAPGLRPVRSYVRRSGRMTEGQRRALTDLWVRYGVDRVPADPQTLFDCPRPCVLEIGFGNGEALVERARQDVARNYLGLEVHEAGVGHALLEIARRELSQVRLSRADASEALMVFDGACFSEICVWFPDPWPKKRHHKRRLIQATVVGELARVLIPGGVLHYATDDADYAAQMQALTISHSSFGWLADDRAGRPVTRFERRAQALGHAVWDLRFVRQET
ncbi:MAG TPA: tRNA (guanosine(46)-N7)-methyltransferase TrmB [Acidiferrobacteraceae bacterium]|nr:tRNA (guanosine(46)-N7)-methyltransferase TrmB [Acidiferrobacteraceae bacterium]